MRIQGEQTLFGDQPPSMASQAQPGAAAPHTPRHQGATHTCLRCHDTFVVKTDGAGVKYCAHCRHLTVQDANRSCRICGDPFVMKQNGASVKYCSPECKAIGYKQGNNAPSIPTTPPDQPCSVCLTPCQPAGHWNLCPDCLQAIDGRGLTASLRRHRAPLHIVARIILDPTCELCGDNLLDRPKIGKYHRWNHAVDHDHTCCPYKNSCGQCIRGVICHRCNSALGQVGDNPDILRAMADYLERHARPT